MKRRTFLQGTAVSLADSCISGRTALYALDSNLADQIAPTLRIRIGELGYAPFQSIHQQLAVQRFQGEAVGTWRSTRHDRSSGYRSSVLSQTASRDELDRRA